MGVPTHPVTFHTHVTFEPRKAILALRKTEAEGITDDEGLGAQWGISEHVGGRVGSRSWQEAWGRLEGRK